MPNYGANESAVWRNMDSVQDGSVEQEVPAEEIMDSIGVKDDGAESEESGTEVKADPLYVQKRLKQQKRAHDRELRELHAKIDMLSANTHQSQSNDSFQAENPYAGDSQNPGIDEQIHKAVSYALGHKDLQERKAKEAERIEHVKKAYGDLDKHLDSVSDKYDDFDDLVRGSTPFSSHIRDASLMLPKDGNGSAGEVLYHLAKPKNREELNRINQLHPLDQVKEVVKLSQALMMNTDKKSSEQVRPLGQVKSNPVTNSASVTEKTSVSELRKRMKQGRKWA